jgi:arylsulfatase A-like enzyme
LYPWQHGVHAKGKLALDPSFPQIGTLLRESGYRTLSLSANGLISPTLGFTAGCDRAAWGVSLFNRVSERSVPPQGSDTKSAGSAAAEGFVRERLKSLSYWAAVYLARYPGPWDFGTRLIHKIRREDASAMPPRMAPWVEPTLERCLQETPADQPVYCFINLLDAHEPYLSGIDEMPGWSEWWDYASTRQDRLGWVSGEWKPTPPELDRLHQLYRGTLELLDRRIGRIIQAFKQAGRWDDTLMILTSDHGQAFGEHQCLFHITDIDEPELRIPLLLRPPRGLDQPRSAVGWASLIDIVPTLLAAAGAPERAGGLPGVNLFSLTDQPRGDPIYALGDGLVHAPDAARAPAERKALIDRVLVGAYLNHRKVVLDPRSGEVRGFDVVNDRIEGRNIAESDRAGFAPLLDGASGIGRKVLGLDESSMDADVEDRLRSWGYI